MMNWSNVATAIPNFLQWVCYMYANLPSVVLDITSNRFK